MRSRACCLRLGVCYFYVPQCSRRGTIPTHAALVHSLVLIVLIVYRCQDTIKRATNRKPQEADCFTRRGAACNHPKCRYHTHLRTCGGTYIKVKEPEPKKKEPKASKLGQKVDASAGKPPRGQRTLSAAFARVSGGRQDGESGFAEKTEKCPTVLDLLDNAIETTSWLVNASHEDTKVRDSDGCTPGTGSRALETDLVNVLDPLASRVGGVLTARGGGVSTAGPSPADSGGGAAVQGTGHRHRSSLVDLISDSDDEKNAQKGQRMTAKRGASEVVHVTGAEAGGQISLLSDSEDDAPERAAAQPSHAAKRRCTGTSSQQGMFRDAASVHKQSRVESHHAAEAVGGVAIDLENAADTDVNDGAEREAVGEAGERQALSVEDEERVRKRKLCAAAAAARLARNTQADQNPSKQDELTSE